MTIYPCANWFQLGRSRNPASDLHGKPYKYTQYGFSPFIRHPCRDRRRNFNIPAPYLVRKFNPV
jgi:hypothetical protein